MFIKKIKLELILLVLIVVFSAFLRLNDLNNLPPGLYTDEVSIGLNAYLLTTTGRDEFNIPHPLWFRSYGDYKLPVYIYSVAASMLAFGKNDFAVRLPSALAGIGSVVVMYFLLRTLLSLSVVKGRDWLRHLPILGALLMAVSSWAIQFSRGGFEVNEGIFFFYLGIWLYLLFIKKEKVYYLLSAFILFVVSMYTYHTFRLNVPVLFIVLSIFSFFKFPKHRVLLIVSLVISFILFLPLLQFSLSPFGQNRFSATSAFSEYPVSSVFQALVLYPLVFLKDYLSFFSFDFLFSGGDGIGRHQVPGFGEMYRWQLPFLIAGIIFLVKEKRSYLKYVTFFLLLLSPFAASFARPSPHALRSLPMVVPYLILISIGILGVYNIVKKNVKIKIGFILIVTSVAIYEFLLLEHFYYVHYPNVNVLDWGAGYKQIVQAVEPIKSKYKVIYVDDKLSYAKTYFAFYDPTIKIEMVSASWSASKQSAPVLYIRPYYGPSNNPLIIKNVYLPTINHDIVAQLWEIK
ncbi:MAG TPA: glycosyltransferase family 39 protein [Patescibacteria group bacterium]|nr:glycosyltransferase family 39 protein [Patescibacteria group bacterium]